MPAIPELDDLFYAFEAQTVTGLSFLVPSNDGLSVVHDGKNASDVEDLNTIYMQVDAEVDPIRTTGKGVIKLVPGRAIYLPTKPCRIFYRCSAGAPCFSVFKRR